MSVCQRVGASDFSTTPWLHQGQGAHRYVPRPRTPPARRRPTRRPADTWTSKWRWCVLATRSFLGMAQHLNLYPIGSVCMLFTINIRPMLAYIYMDHQLGMNLFYHQLGTWTFNHEIHDINILGDLYIYICVTAWPAEIPPALGEFHHELGKFTIKWGYKRIDRDFCVADSR